MKYEEPYMKIEECDDDDVITTSADDDLIDTETGAGGSGTGEGGDELEWWY